MAQILDWIAQSYLSASKPLNASRAVNCFAEVEVQDAKSKAPVAVWGVPGTSPFSGVTEANTLGADVMNDILYVVGQHDLWQVNSDGSVQNLGAHGAQGLISIDNNGLQLVWVDGVTGWVYQPGGIQQATVSPAASGATVIQMSIVGTIQAGDVLQITLGPGNVFSTTSAGTYGPGNNVAVTINNALPSALGAGAVVVDPALTLEQITDPNFFPSNTVTYFDGYFVFVRNGTKEFYLSPLFGITPFNASQFASKEATPDLLLAIANSHEQLYLFGEQRIEVWYDAGNSPPTFPFQRSDGSMVQRGLAAVHSIVVEDNTLFWLGDDLMFYRMENSIPVRLSNHGVEYQWSLYSMVSDAFSLVFTVFGHKIIVLTFPSARKSWALDLATRRWHERESWIGTSADDSIGRWRVSWVLNNVYNRVLVGDSQSGAIAQLNEEVYTEFGDTIQLMLVGAPFHADRRRVFMKRFEVDMETGVGLTAGSNLEDVTYCLRPVVVSKPATMTSASPLPTLPSTYSTALFSVWLNLSDPDATGMILANGGFALTVQNPITGTPQITFVAKDASSATIVSATYDFLGWVNWVNLMVTIDTTTQQLQVWANTLTGGGLAETELTPVSITWSSTNPITAGGAWQISVI